MATKTNKPAPITVATQLYAITEKRQALQAEEDKLKAKLLKNLKDQHVKSIKLEDGTVFTIAERQPLSVVAGFSDEAQLWAEDNYAMKVDTTKALAILRRSLKKLPRFFKMKSSEYLTVRRPNDKNNEEDNG